MSNKESEKIDKGFQLVYWKLSYRRKFIRTLWLSLVTPLFWFIPDSIKPFGLEKPVLIVLLFFVFILQAAYNYYMWKKKK